MASIFGTPNEQNYLMTYTSENSNASIIYDKSLNGFTFKLFNEMFMPMASGESSWLNIRQDEAFKDSEGNPVTTASFDILMENVSEAKPDTSFSTRAILRWLPFAANRFGQRSRYFPGRNHF